MDCGVGYCTFFVLTVILSTGNGVGGKNDPKIFTKDGSVHIRSGDNGNIVFEHPSPKGKVIVAGQELNFINSTGPKGEKGNRGSPGTNGTSGAKGRIGDRGEPGLKGDKGEQGDQGRPGTNGNIGTRGVKGEPGPPGQNGADGVPGPKGNSGDPGPRGLQGDPGPLGLPGMPGGNGTVGEKGENGAQGISGVKGNKGDAGYTAYFRKNESLQCNSSNFGILRYFSTKVQLCTPLGWRYLSFEAPGGCSKLNVPEANYQMFRNADFGVMFDFNKKFAASVVSPASVNVTADILPVNSTLSYQDAVMRQAGFFNGSARLNISGISDDFWRNSNWSVMALLKYKNIGEKFVRVLGHGTTSGHQGLHLGIVVKDKKVIHGYYSNDMKHGKIEADTWYHITWTSEKDLPGNEKRCICINGNEEHWCEENTKGAYRGSGTTTVGAWWHETYDDYLVLDNLIITSGIVQYDKETAGGKQVCFARKLDENLP